MSTTTDDRDWARLEGRTHCGGGGVGAEPRVCLERLRKGTGTELAEGGRGERGYRAVPTAPAEKGGAAGGPKCACVTRRRRVSFYPLAAASAAASPGPRTRRRRRRPRPVPASRLPRACLGRRLPAAASPARSAPSRPRLGARSMQQQPGWRRRP